MIVVTTRLDPPRCRSRDWRSRRTSRPNRCLHRARHAMQLIRGLVRWQSKGIAHVPSAVAYAYLGGEERAILP